MGRWGEREVLTPEEVLERFQSGPRTGVFTDGSCEGNPGPGGWGFVWVEDDRVVRQGSGVEASTTNNRMELTALIAAYRALPESHEIQVFSDSELCVKTVNEWAEGWERRGWRRKGGAIANLELVRELYALARAHPRTRLCWIRAHDGSRWNEYADALAAAYLRR
jgi:ribonuclease HI